MDQQVRHKRREAFIFAEKIVNADKHDFAAADFVNCNERLVRWRSNKGLRAFQFNLVETEDSAMKFLRRFVRRQTRGVVCLPSLASESNTEKIDRHSFHLGRIEHNCATVANIFLQLVDPCWRPIDLSADDNCSISIDRVD